MSNDTMNLEQAIRAWRLASANVKATNFDHDAGVSAGRAQQRVRNIARKHYEDTGETELPFGINVQPYATAEFDGDLAEMLPWIMALAPRVVSVDWHALRAITEVMHEDERPPFVRMMPWVRVKMPTAYDLSQIDAMFADETP